MKSRHNHMLHKYDIYISRYLFIYLHQTRDKKEILYSEIIKLQLELV